MKKQKDFEVWKKHIEGWWDSGVSQREYCQSKNLKLSTFGYWKRKLSTVSNKKNELVEIHQPHENEIPNSRVEIVINGIKLLVGNEIPPEKITKIIQALRNIL